MPYIENSLKKFYKLPLEIIYTVDSKEVERKINEINKKYKVDLFSLVIFVTVGDVKREDVVKYIMIEFNKSKIEAKNIFNEINKVFNYIEKRLKFLDINPNKTSINLEDEEKIILEIFNKKLIRELKHNPVIIYSVNLRIFNILKYKNNFKKELENKLYNNKELLGSNKIFINNSKKSPTISNWIKNFIEIKGNEMFDSIDFSDFITNSPNVKNLNKEDKSMLLKVLKTYNNIKFFPNSMPSDEVDDWEILVIDKDNGDETKKGLKTDKEKNKDELINKEYFQKDEKIAKLIEMKSFYKEDSIEVKAIEEEIEKIKKE